MVKLEGIDSGIQTISGLEMRDSNGSLVTRRKVLTEVYTAHCTPREGAMPSPTDRMADYDILKRLGKAGDVEVSAGELGKILKAVETQLQNIVMFGDVYPWISNLKE